MNNPARYIGNTILIKRDDMFINNDLTLARKKNKNRFVGVTMFFITGTRSDGYEARRSITCNPEKGSLLT
jgi:hypothetical protein